MTIEQCVEQYRIKFNVIGIVDLRNNIYPNLTEIYLQIQSYHKDSYKNNDRILVVMQHDIYDSTPAGLILQSIQTMFNTVDISNFFVELITSNPNIESEYQWILTNISTDPTPIHITSLTDNYSKHLDIYNNKKFSKFIKYQSAIDLTEYNLLDDNSRKLLTENPSFCMLPWTHLMIHPSGSVTPCCENSQLLGNVSTSSLKEIWNSDTLQTIRQSMLDGKAIESCNSCYIKEKVGRDSPRQSSNRSFAKHINKIDLNSNGYVDRFELNYIDSRFNNLCNLACRSCSPRDSSSWHGIAVKLGTYNKDQPAMLIAGKNDTDVYNQIIEHIDYIDKIYFAGGEPLIIEQFYMILDELDRRQRYDIELIYNTNLTRHQYRGRSIFDIWNKFSSVSVGASLDGEYERGEYLRSNTVWSNVINNRRAMIEQCPEVDFYISSTVSIHNALHLPDFHRNWVNKGLIKPEDYNIQILFDPLYMRVDSAPPELKSLIREKYKQHLEWLIPLDRLGRATYGFQSVLNYIDTDRKFDLELFWREVDLLDQYHNTDLITVFPELLLLKTAS
jgi:radical SAM protein with 4Fe4S-binding SPASM domain